MTNDLELGLIYYRFMRESGVSEVQLFRHDLINHFVQDRIADRLVFRDGVLCLCCGQLERSDDQTLRVVPRLKQVGFDTGVPELLLLRGEHVTEAHLVDAIQCDHAKLIRAIQDLSRAVDQQRKMNKNQKIRLARRRHATAKGALWDPNHM